MTVPRLCRRGLLGAGAALAMPGRLRGEPTPAVDPIPSCEFEILRKGSKIGEQSLVFTPSEAGFTSASNIGIRVKVLGVTAYRYDQDGRESWIDGRLREAAASTDDNGKRTRVTVSPSGAGLTVDGPQGRYDVPVGAMTDLAFWAPAIMRQKRIIDAQTGELSPIEVAPPVAETIEVNGRRIAATRFQITGTKGRAGTLWYDSDDRLWRSLITTHGHQLEFRLVA